MFTIRVITLENLHLPIQFAQLLIANICTSTSEQDLKKKLKPIDWTFAG